MVIRGSGETGMCRKPEVKKLRVYANSCNKSNDLIQKIKEVMGYLTRDTLAKACTSFRSRIQTVFLCRSGLSFSSIESVSEP
jgi:hypothetical protein